ncbi:MAG: hypothetical protein JWP42_5081, partial [Pseudomonas sp.]|nr:hypothetical protein [Pseudomonas sp.]
MKRVLRTASLGCGLALIAGCATDQPNSFTFTADLPPDFAYVAAVYYAPAKGETCTLEKKDNLAPVLNDAWRTEYKPDSEITIRRTRNGCPLVVSRIELEINSSYGKDRGDFGGDIASVFIRDEVEDQYKSVFNEVGATTFHGECQWLFRTSGKPRILRKILNCKTIDAQGERGRGQPFAAFTP